MVAGDWWLVAPHFAASRLTGGPGVLSLLFSQGVINDAVSIVLFDASLKQGVQMIAENDGAGPSNVRLSFCLHLYFPGHCSDSSFEPYGVWVYGSWVGVGVAQRQRQRSFCLYLCLCLSVFLCLSFCLLEQRSPVRNLRPNPAPRGRVGTARGQALRCELVCTHLFVQTKHYGKGRSIFSRSTENGPAFP